MKLCVPVCLKYEHTMSQYSDRAGMIRHFSGLSDQDTMMLLINSFFVILLGSSSFKFAAVSSV